VARPLRGDEILACVHRVALNRGQPFEFARPEPSPEMEKRRRDAERHRSATLDALVERHPDARVALDAEHTSELLAGGTPLILSPHLPADREGRRRANVHALVRTGRVGSSFTYAPVLVKNNEVIEVAVTRRILRGSLERLAPGEAEFADGLGVRSTLTVRRNGMILAHATRVLEALGLADPGARAAMIDRHRHVWWFALAGGDYPRFNLAAYDELYQQRLTIITAHDAWSRHGGEFPTSPYWHRDCLDCQYAPHCEGELERVDDVSLTRFTSLDQQILMREHGVATRHDLARLDPRRARLARAKAVTAHADFAREDHLGRVIDKLDDLIYRARAHARSSPLRTLDASQMGCPTADVEVDVDMESYDEATYLWGAYVTLNRPVEGVESGYHAFADWTEPSSESEARVFAQFWAWLSDLLAHCDEAGARVAAYCFWAQAEDGAMNRAVTTSLPGGPTSEDLAAFRGASPPIWLDLHELAARQIQTEGPLGLKQLAGAAGFAWRDENPSGEASMTWFERARGDDPDAANWRTRILEYNEDDCRATKALRDWLNGAARELPHRDDPL
jgi:predicted RecB family nuclease